MRNDRVLMLAFVAMAAIAAGCRRTPAPDQAVAAGPGSDARQRDARESESAWLQLDEAQRQRVRDAAMAFGALPTDEQSRLRAEFARLDRSEQRGWLLGPQIGALWPQLSPLFSYVDEDARAPLLHILHDMNAEELAMLGRIAWRTPPEQRDALLKEVIAVPAANRLAWLLSVSAR